MTTESWNVDPSNPGEVLACAGIAWLGACERPHERTGFVSTGGHWSFKAPFPERAFDALLHAEPEVLEPDDALVLGGIRLDWWQQGHGLNQPFKFWAGQQSARSVLTNLLAAARAGEPRDWLHFDAPTTGRLGVDPLGSWNSLSLGWSANEHDSIQYLCRPYVELLAFFALQCFPVQGSRKDGFRYSLWNMATLPVAILAFARSSVHGLGGWCAPLGTSGSNKILKPAHSIGE